MLDLQGLHARAALFRSVREFFSERGFLEVDTPIRQPVIIPECNIQPIIAEDQYLQTSPELCMKRLLANGCDKIFQICRCYRKNEIGHNHLEEFTMLEWYRTGSDYSHLMNDCEELLQFVVPQVIDIMLKDSPGSVELQEQHFEMTTPAVRLTVADAFNRYSPVSLDEALRDDQFDEVLVEHIEPHLGRGGPLLLIDYPAKLASLAQLSNSNPDVSERFELYMFGVELANGFTELTDPVEQRQRFAKELEAIGHFHGRKQDMPERFLEDLSGIQSAAGIALGLDRLFMQILGKKNVGDVVSFNSGDFC